MNKSKASTAIALTLMCAMTISLVAIPNATAQPTLATYAYIGAVPNPVGVGQEVLLHVGITKELQSAEMGWEDLSITITKPDGTTQTLTGIRTDSTGGTGRVIVPDMPGNWTLQGHFPEQEVTATKRAGGFFTPLVPIGTVLLSSDSEPLTLVVQEDPIEHYPEHPLPTEYWTRPIDPQQREWHRIAGNWLQTPTNYYAIGNEEAPETAHILWSKPLTTGGLVGEPLGEASFEMGDAYEGKFVQRLIVGGKLYYEKYSANDIYKETVCVDVRTGEELWSRTMLDNRTVTFGQLMYWDTMNYHGVYPYLWVVIGSTYHAFNPHTGDWVYTMTNVPSGTRMLGPKGEILIYTVNLANGWMTMWNSSNVPALYGSTAYMSMLWSSWRPYGKTVDAQAPHGVTFGGEPYNPATLPTELTGYQWNVSTAGIPGQRSLPGAVTTIFEGDRIIGGSITTSEVRLWGLSLEPGNEGRLLFNNTWNAPAYWADGNLTVSGWAAGWMAWSQEDYVGVMMVRETVEHFGFCLQTGQNLWGPTEKQYYLDAIEDSPADVRNIAYGKLYSASVSGIVYAYDIQTGELVWTYEAYDPYSEILWANNWWLKPVTITDGKIYLGHTEHSAIDPRPRGAPFICLDAETGEEIWRVNGLFRQTRWGGRGIIGDSVIVTMDTYDQRIYAIGKGPSATTITASPKVSVHGSSILVEGLVTDVSPGTKDPALQMRFPNGVPAVADESMSDWMLYVYKQFPRPAYVTGVEVVIYVLDPNDNFYEVGRTTADTDGFFHVDFEPLVPGRYTIIAEFEGSKSYYGSNAKTAINVQEAPAIAEPTPPPESIADMYFVPAVVGLLIAIIAVGALVLIALRKR